jgi:hypothetical protein
LIGRSAHGDDETPKAAGIRDASALGRAFNFRPHIGHQAYRGLVISSTVKQPVSCGLEMLKPVSAYSCLPSHASNQQFHAAANLERPSAIVYGYWLE